MKHSVLTLGNVYMKTSYDISAPKTHGISIANQFKIEPSGTSVICSELISKLGGDGIICSKIGNDFYGNKILQYCNDKSINSRFLFIDNCCPTGSMTEYQNGDYTVVYHGANENMTEDEIDISLLSYPDIAVFDMNVSSEICRFAFDYAKKYEVKAIASFSNLSYVSDYEYINGCEAIIVDAQSVYALTGITALSPDQCVKSCLKLHYKYSPMYVILSLDERGALSYDGKHCEFYPGIDSSEKFHNLAKTAFTATFAYDYVKNESTEHACKAANIVSAYTEMNSKSIFELPDAEQINEFVKEREIKI